MKVIKVDENSPAMRGGVKVGDEMKKFELVDFVNDEADAGKAATGLTSLVSKKVDVVVGAVTSGATEGLINEAVKYTTDLESCIFNDTARHISAGHGYAVK